MNHHNWVHRNSKDSRVLSKSDNSLKHISPMHQRWFLQLWQECSYLAPMAGLGWKEWCARLTLTGCGTCSIPSNFGISLEPNSVSLPSLSPSCIPTTLILCLRERASMSSTLVWSWVLRPASSVHLASSASMWASRSLAACSLLATGLQFRLWGCKWLKLQSVH